MNVGGATDDGSTALNVTGAGKFSDNVTITASTGNSSLRFTSTTASSKTGYLYADANIIGLTDVLNAGVALEGIFFNSTTHATTLFNNGSISLTTKSNNIVNFSTVPIYATNALALADGLVAGDIYKSSVGVLSIVY